MTDPAPTTRELALSIRHVEQWVTRSDQTATERHQEILTRLDGLATVHPETVARVQDRIGVIEADVRELRDDLDGERRERQNADTEMRQATDEHRRARGRTWVAVALAVLSALLGLGSTVIAGLMIYALTGQN